MADHPEKEQSSTRRAQKWRDDIAAARKDRSQRGPKSAREMTDEAAREAAHSGDDTATDSSEVLDQ